MADRLSRLTPSGLDAEQAALYDAIAGGPRASGPQHFALADRTGALEGPFGLMLHAPGVGAPLQELGAAIRYRTSLSDRHREVAILLVAVATASDFEWFAHVRVGLAAGLSTAELSDLAAGSFVPADPEEAAVVAVCRAVLDDAGPGEEEYAAHRASLGEQTLLELVVLVGYYRTLASMLAFFTVATPVDERSAELPALRP
ncbi:carboxymuconolactone decarboxylase family protein [Nocardioides sp. W7]|uniref:carboxymuconolactone decarboxylase family protein n=1 Tax=Nocardioides sp. W7 TaxID=2931390 RepID=UPI001FD62997|nr:carboxymuconolactone decarboxylase family protein [Nocardioides sp. W7]